jgi:hypothetical protein
MGKPTLALDLCVQGKFGDLSFGGMSFAGDYNINGEGSEGPLHRGSLFVWITTSFKALASIVPLLSRDRWC